MKKFDLIDLNYREIYGAAVLGHVQIAQVKINASMAKRIVADLGMPPALTYKSLDIPISSINRGAALRADQGARALGLAMLVGQVESMTDGVDGYQGFDARAWISRWLTEPIPALGGAPPLDYMGTMEGQALVSVTLARVQSGAYG